MPVCFYAGGIVSSNGMNEHNLFGQCNINFFHPALNIIASTNFIESS